jgi:hypothetical protein
VFSALVVGDDVVRVKSSVAVTIRFRVVKLCGIGVAVVAHNSRKRRPRHVAWPKPKIGGTFVDGVERDFWIALEYRICREFEGFEDRTLRNLGCDGLLPEEYDLHVDEPCIRGTARCGPSGQELWGFTLLIGSGATSPATIDWSSLLPPDDVTGWLSPHLREQRIVIDPRSAYPD